jgi:hypothetical protein
MVQPFCFSCYHQGPDIIWVLAVVYGNLSLHGSRVISNDCEHSVAVCKICRLIGAARPTGCSDHRPAGTDSVSSAREFVGYFLAASVKSSILLRGVLKEL